MNEKIVVTIEHVIMFNDENGFIIFSGTDFDTGKQVSVKGNTFDLNEDDIVECDGKWVTHPKFGLQFDAKEIYIYTPKEADKVLQYLMSGHIKGIGKKTAQNIYDAFGEKSIDILDNNPEELKKIKGIGKKTLITIIDDWNEKRILHKQSEELKELGFLFDEALKISKVLGSGAIETICRTPYVLVTDPSFDFTFDKIDRIALQKLKVKPDDPSRVLTYLIYALRKNQMTGSTYMEKTELFNQTMKKLKVNEEITELSYMAGEKIKKIAEVKKEGVFLSQLYNTRRSELYIAEKMHRLLNTKGFSVISPEEKIKEASEKHKFKLSKGQHAAILSSLTKKVNIINGGPGVGKTTALKILIEVLNKDHYSFSLCAPTGKAAQRMSESTDEEAGTIHKTLEYNPQYKAFQRDGDNPIDSDFVIIDETSMVDVFLFSKVLKAIGNNSTLIIIGDVNQIPSIDAGCVLKDLIESKQIPVSVISELQRQSKNSKIIKNAYLVNEGKFFEVENKKTDDFFFIKTSSDAVTLEKIKEMVGVNIPKAFNLDPKKNVQVLTPTHEKALGRKNLNLSLQEILNKDETNRIKRGDVEFRNNDNVIQMKNNYDKEVFNGDSGEIAVIGRNTIEVGYNGKFVDYERAEFDQLELSYAMTMHKSQGSEYPVVIIPVSHNYSRLLDRSLLYTAITRGKSIVIVIGSERRVKDAIKNDYSRNRKTYLKESLNEVFFK